MKGGIAAAAVAALAGGASAVTHHRHAHELFKKGADLLECSTIWTTITGAPTRETLRIPGNPAF